jgi:hypothetical protein
MFEQQYQANYDWWDERAKLHPATEMYQHHIQSLINAGLIIELFGEHRACPWSALPCCVQGPDRLYRLPDDLADRIPLLFSLKARKPL